MENIALAFSGGGFRAAAFSLGCLSLLRKVLYKGSPLINNVTFISSTSGGSITNLVYSAYIYEGKTFEECYADLNKQLTGEILLSSALDNLKNPAIPWKRRPDKNINLINAFSLEYDKIFKGRTFALFSDRSKNPHLEEVCINSTEFTNGYPFRFQSQHPTVLSQNGLVGNKYIYFDKVKNGIETAKKIKLADILASSSCFPSGFEPFIFPHDYTTETLSKKELVDALSFTENHYTLPEDDYNNADFLADKNFNKELQFGIMDGGVADNQAIDAFMLADERRTADNKKSFDLFISCDVTSYFMDGYTLPVRLKKWYNHIPLNAALMFVVTLYLLIASWLPFSLWHFINNWQWWNTVTSIVSAIFLIPLFVILASKLLSLVKKKKEADSWGSLFSRYKGVFYRMGLGGLQQLILVRAKSVFILANDIYLKQIRRMYYRMLYENPKYVNRIIQCAIYDLSKVKKDFPPSPPPPNEAMIAVAEKSRKMGTTLWFDNNHEKDNVRNSIIATGQFTICYKLLKHIAKIEPNQRNEALVVLEKELMAYYQSFLQNPLWMV